MNVVDQILNIMNQPIAPVINTTPINLPPINLPSSTGYAGYSPFQPGMLTNTISYPLLSQDDAGYSPIQPGMSTNTISYPLLSQDDIIGFNNSNRNLCNINDIGMLMSKKSSDESGLENITSLLTKKLDEYNFTENHLDILKKNNDSCNVTLAEIYALRAKFDKLKGKKINISTLCKDTPNLLEEIQLQLKLMYVKQEEKQVAPPETESINSTKFQAKEGVLKSFYELLAERIAERDNGKKPPNSDNNNDISDIDAKSPKQFKVLRDDLRVILDNILDKYTKLDQIEKLKDYITIIKKELVLSLDNYCYWSNRYTQMHKIKEKIIKWNRDYNEIERDCLLYLNNSNTVNKSNNSTNNDDIMDTNNNNETDNNETNNNADIMPYNKPVLTANLLKLKDTNLEAIGKILDELDVQEIKENLVKHIQNFSHYYNLSKNIVSLQEQPICNICLTNPIDSVLISCGHTACNQCITKSGSSCSICRQVYQKVCPIYF